jgi:preprotein translocase subunit SecG
MYTFITVFIIIASVLLTLMVLVQNSKGGGLASNFQSSNQIMGVRKTADFLEKATWFLAGALLILSIVSTAVIPKQTENGSALKEQVEKTIDLGEVPSFPSDSVK